MGRHTDNPISGLSRRTSSRSAAPRGARRLGSAAEARPGYRRPRSKGRLALGLFAIAAAAGIALVTTIDPYAGATASPYYQAPARASDASVQRFDIDGGYVLVDVKRDSYTIVKPTAPKPVTVAGAAGATGSTSVALGYTTPSGVAQAYAADLVAQRGWAASEFTCLVDLWNRESGWNTHAENPSGAYGIPQSLPGSKMATFGADWQDDYRVQIQWGLSYISGSYGSPCGAWAHSNAYGWY